jgi:hypothetical protein
MKRREFVTTSLAVTSATAASMLSLKQTPILAAAKTADAIQELYELRIYSLKPGVEPTGLHNFLRDAAIPAWNRLGRQPIGVFSPRDATETPQLYVLIPHQSLEAFTTAASRLAADWLRMTLT